ncbi:coproporphyrinogen dehydrogenase HemZ [Faecalibaculum rodentium]|uniref:coproporphyrinogen dehydrogenase HemZ n=1 Tax=Faecalibaculum rodentium TaxID=1702221 RepID=UPI00266F279A|nr:coproporphyrinogen dehydrogenase HemZ [Faecalibaculum rodentium]
MIHVYTNRENYQYDLHALLKSFYPEHDVRVYAAEAQEEHQDDEKQVIIQLFNDSMNVILDIDVRKEYVHTYKNDTDVIKKECNLSIYQDLCDYTGKTLPWGNLTGIRPTKLAMGMLAEGKEDAEIVAWLKAAHAVSDEKAQLSLDIARREKAILDRLHYEDGYSLYIGIPFCPTTCLYCSFTSYPIAVWRKRVDEYLQALFQEIDFVAETYKNKILDTVYIGGGTPTTLEAAELDRLLQYVRDKFDFRQVTEFTVEAGRADSITREKLDVLKKHGVTRISVNPQTMKDETLRYIGRQHTVAQVKDAFWLAREAGFDNINMDIILGLPGELESDVQNTIHEICKLNPDSLTVHSLAVKRASKLSQWIEENGIETLRNTDSTMDIAQKGAYALEMKPYYLYRQKNMSGNFENVGYAREGKYGIYNILIMEEKQTIVACGAGSVSKRVYPDGLIKRSENVKDVSQYIERIGEMIERKRVLLED